ncbi:MAG: MFS transporter [Candidatus Bathyarchaeota archaeon]|nr:MAG: MFS transporter [Candidatus Bathyarchaeota archaeon]
MRFREGLKKEFSFIRGNYLILIISWILMDFARELAAPYYPEYVRQLGATESIVGAIGFVSFIALASVQFPGGFLADKYGRRWLVSTLTFGVALSYIFFAIAPTWHFIMIGTLVESLCLLYQPALLAMMADSMPPERRGMGYSIINLIMSVTTTPGAAVGLALVVQYGLVGGLRIGYVIIVVFFLAAATLRLRLKESIKEDTEKMQLSELVKSYPRALKEGMGVWKAVPRSTLFLFISGLLVRLSFAISQFIMLFYALDVLLISEAMWGLATIALFSTMIVVAFPAGKLIDKIGRKIPLILSLVVMVPAIYLFVYGDVVKLFISLPLFGIGQLLAMSAYQSLLADLVPREQRGKVIGSSNFFSYIFMAFGSLMGGILYQIVSPQLPFLLEIVFIIPAIFLILFLVHEPEKREE